MERGLIQPMNRIGGSLGDRFLTQGFYWLKDLHKAVGLEVKTSTLEFHVSKDIYYEFAQMCDFEQRCKTVDGFKTYGLKGHPVVEAYALPADHAIIMAPIHTMELSPSRGKEENRYV